jgi:hypothetical protein
MRPSIATSRGLPIDVVGVFDDIAVDMREGKHRSEYAYR